MRDKKRSSISLSVWQGKHDSNMQPTVLETATLPLSYSPKKVSLFSIQYQFFLVNCFWRFYYEKKI